MLISNKELFAALAAVCLFTASAGAQTEFVCAGLDTAINIHGAGKSLEPRSTSGSLSALVIFADFEEGTLSAPLPAFATRLFDRERPGSLSHFYDTMSAGQFAVQGTVLPRRYHSNSPASDYVATAVDQRGRYGQFVREILQKAGHDIDFGQFDNDGADGIPNSGDDDGVVDYIFVNIATTPAWFFVGNATGVGGLGMDDSYESGDLTPNGVPIQIFGHSSGGSVLREGNYEQTVGAMAHELGHHLGLPDLFDRSYSSPAEDSAGIGRWGLMAWGTLGWNGTDGPNPFSAWSLEQLGWIGIDNESLVEVSGEHSVSEFSPLVEGGLVYKLATRDPSEYFLVEHRQPGASHYERSLPGDGL